MTKLESVFLEWSCQSVEMRNIGAVHCHVDGNKSRVLESLYYCSSKKIVNGETSQAYLYLLFYGCTIKMDIGSDIIHCGFKKTYQLS